jgi:flagellar hook-associated protein 3 FlgL
MALIDRISTSSQHLQSMDSLSATQNRLARLQEQVSSGKAFQRASEDPSAVQSAMKLSSAQKRNAQAALNIDTGLLRLQTAQIQVDSVTENLLRAQSIVRQGQLASTTASERAALAAEIDVILGGLRVAANSDFAGRQLFAGTSAAATAYDASGNYLGDTNQVLARIDSDSTVRTELNGTEVFGVGAANAFATLTSISSNLINDPGSLAANETALNANVATAVNAQVTIASRINQLNGLGQLIADKDVSLTGALSNVQDTDLMKTIMELTLEQTGYQAALQATASVMQPSLMDFLR